MPFQFTGEPPPLKEVPPSFASFRSATTNPVVCTTSAVSSALATWPRATKSSAYHEDTFELNSDESRLKAEVDIDTTGTSRATKSSAGTGDASHGVTDDNTRHPNLSLETANGVSVIGRRHPSQSQAKYSRTIDTLSPRVRASLEPTMRPSSLWEKRQQRQGQCFRFLDLPAEMRNSVYREIFAPTGSLSLRNTTMRTSKSLAVVTTIEPKGLTCALLRTCRQVYDEAIQILFDDNTLFLDMSGDRASKAILVHDDLPNCILPKLRLVMFTCDPHRDFWWTFADFSALERMTNLKKARICMLDCQYGIDIWHQAYRRQPLRVIIERMPAGCVVSFGSATSAEREHVQATSSRATGPCRRHMIRPDAPPNEVDGEVLRDLARGMEIEQGMKSGSRRAYPFQSRAPLPTTTLTMELAAAVAKTSKNGAPQRVPEAKWWKLR